MFVADSMRFFRAPTTSIDSVNSAQMINKIEVLIRVKDGCNAEYVLSCGGYLW